MRIITLEEHFLTPELLHMRARVWPHLQSPQKLLDLGDGRIADMDEAGIDMQVLSAATSGLDEIDSATAVSLARDANDRLASAIRKHPTRFAGFATLALRDPAQSAIELERCVRSLGFKGALVDGTIHGKFLDDPQFAPVLEAAQALGAPIYLHPAPPPQAIREAYFGGLPSPAGFLLATSAWGWHVETGMHSLRLILSGAFDRFPKLKIIIGHMGENLPFSLARADAVLRNGAGHLKRPVADYFHEHFYVTTSGYFTLPPFLCALQVLGEERLLFSVDYPFASHMAGRKFLDSLPVSPEAREKISYRNAERVLKL